MSRPDHEDVLSRIDALLGPETAAASGNPRYGARLETLARRAARGAPPPAGEVLVPVVEPGGEWSPRPVDPDAHQPPNMGAPGVRIDHWDAYVCRFDDPPHDDGPDRHP